MEYALAGLLLLFLVFLFVETRRKTQRIQQAIAEEKRIIADESGMTASIGVFSPDTQTTVVIGASEQLGLFYYRMLRQNRVIIKSRINLANLSRVEFLLNGQQTQIPAESEQLTVTMQATEIADRAINNMSPDSIRQINRAAMRVNFYDEAGSEKNLEITTFRSSDERQRLERVPLLKNTIWWTAYLQLASRLSRQARASLENPEPQAN